MAADSAEACARRPGTARVRRVSKASTGRASGNRVTIKCPEWRLEIDTIRAEAESRFDGPGSGQRDADMVRHVTARPIPAGHPPVRCNAVTREEIVAVKKSAGRWSGSKKSTHAAAGERDAATDRKLQREAEQKRSRSQSKEKEAKKTAVQAGARSYPAPPLPKQHLEKPGLESQLKPRPQYEAPEYRGSGKLEGKVALITGGDSGIGRAVAVLFAREGADVAIVYLSEHEDAEETRRAVEAEGRRALLIPGDVTSSAFCQEAVESTVQELGRLDILVNNAAFQEHAAALEDITDEQLER